MRSGDLYSSVVRDDLDELHPGCRSLRGMVLKGDIVEIMLAALRGHHCGAPEDSSDKYLCETVSCGCIFLFVFFRQATSVTCVHDLEVP